MGIIRRDRYKRGDWNAISDQSGQKYKASDMRMQWDNTWVGRDEWSPKHPQLEIRARQDNPARYPVRNVEPITKPLPPYAKVADVYDADLNPYPCLNIVYDTQGIGHIVSEYVFDSDGAAYKVFEKNWVILPDEPNVYFIPPTVDQGQMV